MVSRTVARKMILLLLLLGLLVQTVSLSGSHDSAGKNTTSPSSPISKRYPSGSIGVNYGQLGNNLPSPAHTVKLLKHMRVSKVKIYDANPRILTALANTAISVTLMVPNQQIPDLASSQRLANEWIKHNVSFFYPRTRIRTLLVGNEILSDFTIRQTTWPKLVPAMQNLHRALHHLGLHRRIKVSTPHALQNVLQSYVFPPSNGTFRADISNSVMRPLLQFLREAKSELWVDTYPFFTWEFNRATVSLDFALFNASGGTYSDPGNGLVYYNLLDVQLDSIVAAISKLGYEDIQLVLSESGWPTKGGLDERGANFYNAALYNRRLVRRVLRKPAVGTPRRPHQPLPAYIFALFNENLKPGPVTERNWGLLRFLENGTVVPSYEIDLLGRTEEDEYEPMVKPSPEPEPGSLRLWCVANESFDGSRALQDGLDYACGAGGADCSSVQPGGECFSPNTTVSHASFAFNEYYVKQRVNGGSCDFNGVAYLTSRDPSYASCNYPPIII